MGDVQKDQQDGLTPEQQFDEAWDKLDAEEAAQKSQDQDTGLPDDPGPGDSEDETKSKTAPTDSESLKKDSDEPGQQQQQQQGESAEAKALRDTKAWATKLSQENAELKRLIAEGATKKEIDDQQKTVDAAKKDIKQETLEAVYREYPELKSIFDPLVSTIKALQEETEATKRDKAFQAEQQEAERKKKALEQFETQIMPKVMEGPDGHPDFKDIIATQDFFEWAEKQRPALKTAALMSNDPTDIKWALTEYKKQRAIPEAEKLKQQEAEKRQQRINNQMTLRGGSSALSQGKSSKVDPNDYDAAWAQAEKEDRR